MTQIIPQQSFSLILFICECIYFNSRTSKQKIDIDPIEKFRKKPFLSLRQHPDDKLLNILLLKGQNEFCKFNDQSLTLNLLNLIEAKIQKGSKSLLNKSARNGQYQNQSRWI
ncbi:unnamed protein product [Paramecium octaurelia]|uniref:Uncharacterized protein n=1 Tax=Paramecium octaurelia TaxID=43137 RepID=A0A8S1YQQ0_PAROT|nr:unnamed protein product [Paramecium octaurelia]